MKCALRGLAGGIAGLFLTAAYGGLTVDYKKNFYGSYTSHFVNSGTITSALAADAPILIVGVTGYNCATRAFNTANAKLVATRSPLVDWQTQLAWSHDAHISRGGWGPNKKYPLISTDYDNGMTGPFFAHQLVRVTYTTSLWEELFGPSKGIYRDATITASTPEAGNRVAGRYLNLN